MSRDADEAEQERARLRLEESLNRLTEIAGERVSSRRSSR